MEKPAQTELRKQLKRYRSNFLKHLQHASEFLIRCQVLEPYVVEGSLRGTVCPWEIAKADPFGFTVFEDFHDTLQAIWVWSYYTYKSGQSTFLPHIQSGWNYVLDNFHRFIPPNERNQGLYDCAHLLNTAMIYNRIFADESLHTYVEAAGNRLGEYLDTLRPVKGRSYSDPWWMTYCLASAAQGFGFPKWVDITSRFVHRTILKKKEPFRSIEKEPKHRGRGRHDFFSQNAMKSLALLACSSFLKETKDVILAKYLPVISEAFIPRHIDENAWNASVAWSLGKCYLYTKHPAFLKSYFSIMRELSTRDTYQNGALSRAPDFPLEESWVAFFYTFAYAAILE